MNRLNTLNFKGILTGFLLTLSFFILPSTFAQEEIINPFEPTVTYKESFYKGRVLSVGKLTESDRFGFQESSQKVEAEILSGDRKGEQVTLEHYVNLLNPADNVRFERGDRVILTRSEFNGVETFDVFEPYRLSSIFWLLAMFLAVVIFISRKKGMMSILGLGITLLILVYGIIPLILEGYSPFWTSFIGSVIIATVTLYMAHGFTKRTTLSLISTLLTLFIALLLSLFAVEWTQLFGLGSEEAAYLTFGNMTGFDLKGLLLGAIVIGTLGVLDDVTTTQTAAIHEIHKANKKYSFKELYDRGLSVGREHISSLVNTLVIAYVGVSFPLLILITQSEQPLWVVLNNEFMAEEIVRTLVGSTALVLAVPISSVIAAHYYTKKA